MTRFKPLYEIADGVRKVLENTGAFKHTTVAAISTGNQIWVSRDILNALPAAVVCVGNGAFKSRGLVRDATVLIIVVDSFKSGTEAKAKGVWPLIDTTCNLFIPQVEPNKLPVMPIIDGIEYELRSFIPIESEEKISAFGIELNGAEGAVYEIEKE